MDHQASRVQKNANILRRDGKNEDSEISKKRPHGAKKCAPYHSTVTVTITYTFCSPPHLMGRSKRNSILSKFPIFFNLLSVQISHEKLIFLIKIKSPTAVIYDRTFKNIQNLIKLHCFTYKKYPRPLKCHQYISQRHICFQVNIGLRLNADVAVARNVYPFCDRGKMRVDVVFPAHLISLCGARHKRISRRYRVVYLPCRVVGARRGL